jgi:hypothetical protein
LQAHDALKGFYLVGGTALALQLGHRNSIDIDLFTTENFEPTDLMNTLGNEFSVEATFSAKNTLLSFVDRIKTDFITHNYPLINPPITE